MSIDATIVGVVETGDDPRLILGPRVSADGRKSLPGQNVLRVTNRPCPPLRGLLGCNVWGGSESILVGDTVIAKRVGYRRIDLLPPKAVTP